MSEFHNGEKHQKAEAFISFRKRSWLSDPIKNLLSEAQRAEIGAIGLASQALIKALDPLLPLSIANGLFLELIKRQAGNTPEKIKWMILGLNGLPISNSLRDGIKKSLDAAKHFFHLRHSVIHCDLLDSTTGIYQGNPVSLIKEDLEFIYNNLCCIRDEINSAVTLLSKLAQINALDDADQSKSLLSKEVQELENQLQILLAQRGSVARPPGLPSESQLVEAEARHQAAEATKAIESPWHPFFQFAEAMPPHYLRQGFPYRGFAEQSWVPGPLPEEKKD